MANKDTRLDILIRTLWDGKGSKQAKDDVGGLSGNLSKLAGVASGAIVSIGTAAVAAGAASIRAAASFEQGFNEVLTLLPQLSEEGIGAMRDDIREFVTETGRATNEALPALYQAISAGVPQQNVFEFLRTANEAAKGGVTDLETAVNGITSVVNAYGSEVVDATAASDLMFTAVKGGKTTFDELSRSLFQAIPIAASLGVEFGNITAATATLTAQGTPTSVAMTQIRQLLSELSKAGTKTSDVFQDVAGVGFRDFIAQGYSLQDALVLMEQRAQESNKSISDMFSSVEAGNAALGLTGQGASKFASELEAAAQSAGATGEAADRMGGTLSESFSKATAKLEILAVTFGEKLGPVITPVLSMIEEGLDGIIEKLESEAAQKFFNNLSLGAKGFFGDFQRQVEAQINTRISEADSLEDYSDLLQDLEESSNDLQTLDAFALGGLKNFKSDALKQIRMELLATSESSEDFIAKVNAINEMSDVDLFMAFRGTSLSYDAQIGEFYEKFKEDADATATAVASANEESAESIGEVAGASIEAAEAQALLAQQQRESEAAAQAQREAMMEARKELNAFFDRSMQLINQPVSLADFFYEAGLQAGVATEDLMMMAIATGEVTQEQAELSFALAEAQQYATELATAVAEGTITREEAAQSLEEEYGATIRDIQAKQDLVKAEEEAAQASRDVSLARQESIQAAQAEREAMRELTASYGDVFTAKLNQGEATFNAASALLAEADAAGAGVGALALLAQQTGEFSDAQIKAALAAVALEEKAKLLGAAIANGMDVNTAIAELETFKAALDGEYAITVDDTSVQEAIGKTEELLGIAAEPVIAKPRLDLAELEGLTSTLDQIAGVQTEAQEFPITVDYSSIEEATLKTVALGETATALADTEYIASIMAPSETAINDIGLIEAKLNEVFNKVYQVKVSVPDVDIPVGSAAVPEGAASSGSGSDPLSDEAAAQGL